MVPWSYGNRLFRPAWYEKDDDEVSRLSLGPYRHSNGQLYRKFQHSWPLYRRHISTIARRMGTTDGEINVEDMDDGERSAVDEARHSLDYWKATYWRRPKGFKGHIYYATIDLEKFYPRLSTSKIFDGLMSHCADLKQDRRFKKLLRRLLDFHVDDSGITQDILEKIEPNVPHGDFSYLPTGLFAAGFLANAAMTSVDLEVQRRLKRKGNIAHFRFVDDHTILVFNFSDLERWIETYRQILQKRLPGVDVEKSKTEPGAFRDYLTASSEERSESLKAAMEACRVDGRRPLKLMTTTLAQVSMAAAADIEILTEEQTTQRLRQLEWLLQADLPDHEIRADTRVSFAAGKIGRIIPANLFPSEEVVKRSRILAGLKEKQKEAKVAKRTGDSALEDDLRKANLLLAHAIQRDNNKWNRRRQYYFDLLLHAFVEHPDKIRLYLKMFDYCAHTGYGGLSRILEWLRKNRRGPLGELVRFYSALALQQMSAHIVGCAGRIGDQEILARERTSAEQFLERISSLPLKMVLANFSGGMRYYEVNVVGQFRAALRLGSITAALRESNPEIRRSLDRAASIVGGPTLRADVTRWRRLTGFSSGVWLHWCLGRVSTDVSELEDGWRAFLSRLDLRDHSDATTLRRYPKILSEIYTSRRRVTLSALRRELSESDDGIILEVAAHAKSPQESKRILVSLRRSHLIRETEARISRIGHRAYIPLNQWVAFLQTLDPNDPRGGEWTALEIMRQTIKSAGEVRRTGPVDLVKLHPSSIFVPKRWTSGPDIEIEGINFRTWEAWRRETRLKSFGVRVTPALVRDYRFNSSVPNEYGQEAPWQRERRVLGLLLWGLLRKSFHFPQIWNLRGQERSAVGFVTKHIDDVAISSETLRILDSCLTLRAQENLYVQINPQLWGLGTRLSFSVDEYEPQPIRDEAELVTAMRESQKQLVTGQMSIMKHMPRQLIPVDVGVLQRTSFSTATDLMNEADQ